MKKCGEPTKEQFERERVAPLYKPRKSSIQYINNELTPTELRYRQWEERQKEIAPLKSKRPDIERLFIIICKYIKNPYVLVTEYNSTFEELCLDRLCYPTSPPYSFMMSLNFNKYITTKDIQL